MLVRVLVLVLLLLLLLSRARGMVGFLPEKTMKAYTDSMLVLAQVKEEQKDKVRSRIIREIDKKESSLGLGLHNRWVATG